MFKRPVLQRLTKRIEEPRRFIQILMGPRQVGKTTLVTQLNQNISIPNLYESADAIPVSNGAWLEQLWETVRVKMAQQEAWEFLLIIDEIQKVKNWSETVKRLWDEDTRVKRNLKVILLGSSRLLLQQGLTESLTGRFETTYLGHWSFMEMSAAFGWDARQYAWFGGFPGSASLINDELRWKQYINNSIIDTSISKDILMLTRVDKPALMKNLFEIGCMYSGQILSFTKIQGQLQDAGNTTTLSHYLNLLDTAGLLTGIEKYVGTVIRKRASSPKFQVHNTALLSAQQHQVVFNAIITNPALWGRVVESAIGAHLINYALTENFKIYYWRYDNREVDFVMESGEKIICLEVKSNMTGYASGMTDFEKQFGTHKALLIGQGGIPWQEFLQINPAELFS